jgi:acetyltransferase-like isoleucine patch superfamily enzyme
VSGNVTVEHSAYLGSGAILAPGIRVCEEAVVGVSTSVFRSVDAGSTIVGNPPRVIRSRETGHAALETGAARGSAAMNAANVDAAHPPYA